jgi:endonuclease/exonuclease/phosphatase family metal-dependent hydrolase
MAKFATKRNGELFYVINYHSRKYYDNPEEEIVFFNDYPARLSPDDNIFIAGDFNLSEEHEVWGNLYAQGFTSALKKSKTTLRQKCKKGKYLSRAIDNIYFSQNINLINSSTIDFVVNCENLENARLISDHLPVLMEFKLH